jgi:lipopolysaccharide/colanic/teichoic acid biosynthesis glycosyltransferase
MWRRILDLIFILLSAPLWVPVMILVAWWIKHTSPGPIFFGQTRVGYGGKCFRMLKFRTLRMQSAKSDARIVPGIRILQSTGLDELPQIFNVLKGEMSLWGPRPCSLAEFGRYTSCPQHKRLGGLDSSSQNFPADIKPELKSKIERERLRTDTANEDRESH